MMKREGNIEIPQACQRATHLPDYIIPARLVSTGWQAGLTTLVNTPVKTTPTGLTTLSGCDKNEIQFSKYLASGETVIHRAQAVRACLLPFYIFFNNN